MIVSHDMPCLEPDIVTGDYFYPLETQQNTECPTVYNNNRTLDTRYTKTDTWTTNVLDV